MMKNKTALIVTVIVVLGAAGGVAAYMIHKHNNDKAKTATTQTDSMDKMAGMDNTAKSTTNDQTTKTDTGATTSPAQTTAITIHNYAFDPEVTKVKVGDTVTWTNQDDVEHDIIADTVSADAPNGPLLSKGKSYSFKFTKAGTYAYHCGLHPYMKGTIEVSQ